MDENLVLMDDKLYEAAKEGKVTSLDELQKEKPDILMRLTPYHRETVCHVALRYEKETFAWEAYSRNPILCTFKSKKGDYLLHWVLKARKEDFFKKCIESKWSVSCSDPSSFLVNDEGKSLMFLAVEMGSLEAVNSLLGSSFGTNCCGPNNSTALHAAVFQPHNRHEILKNIVPKFPELLNSVDGDGNTPLYQAISLNNKDLLGILQDRDTAHISNEAGLTPIHLSASLGYLPVFKRLLEINPESIWLTTNKNKNVLHLSVEAGNVNIAQAIIERPEFRKLLYEKDEDGNTPLHIAATIGGRKMQQALKDNSTMPLIKNREGLTVAEVEKKSGEKRKEEAHQNQVIERQTRRKTRLANLEVLLVVDTLLLSMAYSAVLNVPGGYDDHGIANLIPRHYLGNATLTPRHYPGNATLTLSNDDIYTGQSDFLAFLILNTVLFTTAMLSLFSAILSIFLESPGLYQAALVLPCVSFIVLVSSYSYVLSAVTGPIWDPIITWLGTGLMGVCFIVPGMIVRMLLKERGFKRASNWITSILLFCILAALFTSSLYFGFVI